MLYMLDTNIVSYLLEKNPTVVNRFDDVFLQNEIKISNIVNYEIQRGIFAGNQKNCNMILIFSASIFQLCLSPMQISCKRHASMRIYGEKEN